MTPGDKALEALRLLSSASCIGDYVYNVRERELKGWDGPRVTAWGKGAALADEALKEAGISVEELWKSTT